MGVTSGDSDLGVSRREMLMGLCMTEDMMDEETLKLVVVTVNEMRNMRVAIIAQ